MQLDERELGAVLAGLRLMQEWMDPTADLDSVVLLDALTDILTDGKTHERMEPGEIDRLCERLNTAPDPPEWAFDTVLDMACQGIVDEYDEDMAEQRAFQEKAVDLVRDYLHQNKIWR